MAVDQEDKRASRKQQVDGTEQVQEDAAHVMTYDPTKGDDENVISREEIEETVEQGRKGKGTTYYKTLAQENAENNGETDEMDKPLDEGFAGLEESQLAELSMMGRFKRRYNGVLDRGDYFALIADKRGQVTDEALRQTIMSLVLVKGYSTLYFYRQGKIDPTISSRASIILDQMKQPGGALEGRTDLKVETVSRMKGLEPWKANITGFNLPLVPHEVNHAINKVIDIPFGGIRAAILEPFDQRSKRKEARKMQKASVKSKQNEKKVAKDFINKSTGERVGDRMEAEPTKWQLLRNPGLAFEKLTAAIMSRLPSGRAAMREQEIAMRQEQSDAYDKAWRKQNRPQEVAAENLAATNITNSAMAGGAAVAGRSEIIADDDHLCPTKITDDADQAETHGEETSSSGGGGKRPEPSEDFAASAEGVEEKTEARASKEVKSGEPDPVEDGLKEVADGIFDGEAVTLDEVAAEADSDIPIEPIDRDNKGTSVSGQKFGQ